MRMSKATVLAGFAGLVLTVSPVLAQGGAGGGGRGGDRQGQPGGDQGGGGRRFGGMGMGGGMMGAFNNPAMTSRDLAKYGDILALDKDQKEAAKALLDGYEQAFNTKRDEMREKMQQAREDARNNGGGGGGGMGAFREIAQKWTADREKLDKDFMNDLKGLLTPDQEKANWARFERVHRRDHSMDRGLISGERMDVIKLVDDAKLDAATKAKVDPILARYEEDLDREIQNRDQVQKDVFAKMADAMGGGDPEAMQKLVQTGREAAVRVRDVNRRYAREVQAELPEDKQFEFAKAVKQASFPNVYNETFGQRSITSALGFRDLTDDQKQTIQTIRDAYNRDLAGLNDKIAAAQEQMEMNFNVGQMMQGGRPDQGELGDLRREKRDLERATLDKIEATLTEDQKARLPKPEPRGQGGPGAGRGGDQGGGDNAGQNRRQRNRPRNPDRET